MTAPPSLRFSTQAQLDIRRMTQQLTDLQRQVGSGKIANDLAGFGGGASRLVSAQGMLSAADARSSAVNQLEARFGVQASTLSQISEAVQSLAQTLREAVSANDGRAVATELELTFMSAVSALNGTWNGQPLFGGERTGAGAPIRISTLDELVAATTPDDLFNESKRKQIIDLGVGAPISLADRASELATALFDTMREMKLMVDAAGGEIGAPLSTADRDRLLAFTQQLDAEAQTFISAEGRAGQLQKRFEAERVRLQDRSNLMVKEIGEQSDADIGEVSIQISALLVQYEAAAKTFSDLSKLTLLDYL